MENNILLATFKLDNFVLEIFRELSSINKSLYLVGNIKHKNAQNWPINFFYFGPKANNFFSFLSCILLLPAIYLLGLIKLLLIKKKCQSKIIVCVHFREKIIISPLAAILKIKCIWLELPQEDYHKKNKLSLFLYRFFSRCAQVLVFTSLSEHNLKKLKVKDIARIPPGLREQDFKHQDNLFSELAHLKSQKQHRFFTIGTVTFLDDKNKIETLCQAVRQSLRVAPNLQLIVVGGGPFGPKNSPWTKWLTKKMEIDNLCWFVGEQDNIKKWLNNFDVFVFLDKILKTDDFNAILGAMISQVPIIGLDKSGLDDLLENNKSGLLLETMSSQELSESIIRLYKDDFLRKRLAQAAQVSLQGNFTIAHTLSEFKKYL